MGPLWLLLGCTSPSVALSLPPATPAEHADALDVDRLLTPTPLAASSPATLDLLCPWARGEPVADASIARWLAEGRLAWRVYDATTDLFAGEPLAKAGAIHEAAVALDARCGSKLADDVLIAAGPETKNVRVQEALIRISRVQFDAFWLLVDDPTPGPPGPTDTIVPGVSVTIAVTPLAAFGVGGVKLDGLGAALALHPECAVVAVSGSGTWLAPMDVVDELRAGGAEVMLAAMIDPEKTGAIVVGAAPGPARQAPLHGTVSAFPIVIPRYCDSEGPGCGCGFRMLTLFGDSRPGPEEITGDTEGVEPKR